MYLLCGPGDAFVFLVLLILAFVVPSSPADSSLRIFCIPAMIKNKEDKLS